MKLALNILNIVMILYSVLYIIKSIKAIYEKDMDNMYHCTIIDLRCSYINFILSFIIHNIK